MSVISSTNAGLTSSATALVVSGKVQNLTLTNANQEYPHTFPANTKAFLIQARGNARLNLSYTSGESGTIYRTIWPGSFVGQDGISSATTTVYLQSPTAGAIVELESWV